MAVLAALAAAVVALPAGLAVADGGDEIGPSAAAKTDCPEAAEFSQSIGFGGDTYGATCPSVDQLKVSNAADAQAGARSAEVGGPPTRDFNRCPHYLGNRPCTEPVVLGARRVFNGSVELVGYDSRGGTCLEVDHPAADISSGGFCGSPLRPRSGSSIDLIGWSFLSPGPPPDFTDLVGTVTDDTARVRVRYRRNGERRVRNALLAPVDAELAAKVGEDEPFTAFAATLRGCIQVRTVRLTAFDASGAVLGKARPSRRSACPNQ